MSIIKIRRTQNNVRDQHFSLGEMLELFQRLVKKYGEINEVRFAYVDDDFKEEYLELTDEIPQCEDGDVLIVACFALCEGGEEL